MITTEWKVIASCPEDTVVQTKVDDGVARNECLLVRKGNLFFLTDMSMYVYYTPTHWRPVGAYY